MSSAPSEQPAPTGDSLLERAYLRAIGRTDTDIDPTAEKLLDAAFELFCRSGIQRTSMERVAQCAGVTRVTLYRKFATKDVLVEEVVLREFRSYFDDFLTDIRDATTVADRVVLGFVRSLRALSGNPLISGMFATEPEMLIGSMIGDDGRLFATVRGFVAGQLRREQHAGNVDADIDVDLIAEMMVRISASFLTVPSRIVDITDEDELATIARMFVVPMLNKADDI
ncbi:TetR family transcriptional regulator [Gordonia sp. ABSL1-1]|uniref:TetR/AcrR family transcriptional regulator n=1 Tax=Gordonia sp. ABSL1-1 TaxID=3053923 RepID=UPI0025735B75|nr:TetR/AcrR family transcriptional regulator [Gordonia sp. ABSL1-1]MDL9937996.1 TetR family transcriptional regulator [Gordonia sp. ABSL1-1]